MQKKLQREKANIKSQQTPSKQEKYVYKEVRIVPRDADWIHSLADRLWEYAKKEDTYNFEDFCADEGMTVSGLKFWRKDPYFKEKYEQAKLKIGARLDKGLWNKSLEYRMKISMYNYLDRYKEDDKYEDDRAVEKAIRTNKEAIQDLAKANQLKALQNLDLKIKTEGDE